jgi:hypothetical protein
MAIIKNFGLMWERAHIFWGWSGVPGELRGWNHRTKGEVVDFREQIGVYVLFNKERLPIYSGQAGYGRKTLFDRLKDHQGDHLWNRWEYFSWFGFRAVTTKGLELAKYHKPTSKVPSYSYQDGMNELEALLISVVEPKNNKQSGRWKKSEQYFQLHRAEFEKEHPGYAGDIELWDLYRQQENIMKKIDQLLEESPRKARSRKKAI